MSTAPRKISCEIMNKSMIYSPSHGYLAFTVPLFEAFIRRAAPEFGQGR